MDLGDWIPFIFLGALLVAVVLLFGAVAAITHGRRASLGAKRKASGWPEDASDKEPTPRRDSQTEQAQD